jgi:hypothetical protein
MLHVGAADIVNQQICQMDVMQNAFVSTHKNPERVGTGKINGVDVPVFLVE